MSLQCSAVAVHLKLYSIKWQIWNISLSFDEDIKVNEDIWKWILQQLKDTSVQVFQHYKGF